MMSPSNETGSPIDLTDAVEKTRGFQPWRRAFHAMNGTLVVLALSVFGLPLPWALVILGCVLALTVALDVTRLLDPKLNLLFFRTFSSLASPREEKKIASSTWYALSCLLVLLLFPVPYALAGILVLAWADPAANIIGQRWGRRPFLGGTVVGTLTFAVVAFPALLLFVPWPKALLAALVTAFVEALPVELDDNLVVPVTASTILSLLTP